MEKCYSKIATISFNFWIDWWEQHLIAIYRSTLLNIKFISDWMTFLKYLSRRNAIKVHGLTTILCKDNRFFFFRSSVRIWQCEISVFGVGVRGKKILLFSISRKLAREKWQKIIRVDRRLTQFLKSLFDRSRIKREPREALRSGKFIEKRAKSWFGLSFHIEKIFLVSWSTFTLAHSKKLAKATTTTTTTTGSKLKSIKTIHSEQLSKK